MTLRNFHLWTVWKVMRKISCVCLHTIQICSTYSVSQKKMTFYVSISLFFHLKFTFVPICLQIRFYQFCIFTCTFPRITRDRMHDFLLSVAAFINFGLCYVRGEKRPLAKWKLFLAKVWPKSFAFSEFHKNLTF